MPGLKLNFLKSASQRVANSRPVPLKQVEAVVLYGTPEQRAKVVEKLLPNVYGLSLNAVTHHVLMTLLDRCDNLDRVKLLYCIRRNLADIALSPVGNKVLQKMLDVLPSRQRSEVAEAFVLNVNEDEFKKLAEHSFGNHVAQKMVEFKECLSVVEEKLQAALPALSIHEYGMRVVGKYITEAEGGWKAVLGLVFHMHPDTIVEDNDNDKEEEEALAALDRELKSHFSRTTESMLISALWRHPLVPLFVKDAMCAHLCEYKDDYLLPTDDKTSKEEEEFALPDFSSSAAKPKSGSSTKHIHSYCSLMECGTDSQREMLWGEFTADPTFIPTLMCGKATAPAIVAAIRHFPECRKQVLKLLLTKRTLGDVAMDPVLTLLLRAIIEVDASLLSQSDVKALMKRAAELAKSPIGSPVLQKLTESDASGKIAGLIFAAIKESLEELVRDGCGSYLVQAVLLGAAEEQRRAIVKDVMEALGDLQDSLSYPQGSRVLQRSLAYAEDEVIISLVNQLVSKAEEEREAQGDDEEADEEDDEEGDDDEEGEESEEKPEEETTLTRKEQKDLNRKKHYHVSSNALFSYATHAHACYVIQALLLETRKRQLTKERVRLMGELKPFVFDLSVSPWAGRIVLEAMLQVGSTELKAAIKNVVFLKAEAWLTDGPDKKGKGKQKGTVDPTLRGIMKRSRDEGEGEKAEAKSGKPPKKKMHRTLKR